MSIQFITVKQNRRFSGYECLPGINNPYTAEDMGDEG